MYEIDLYLQYLFKFNSNSNNNQIFFYQLMYTLSKQHIILYNTYNIQTAACCGKKI